jgi:hypothetical protein
VVFSMGSFPGYITDDSSSWLSELRGQFQLRVSIWAEQQSSEKSCRRTDPAMLGDRQRVKIQCEDLASVIVNCREL